MLNERELNTIYKFNLLNLDGLFRPDCNKRIFFENKNFLIAAYQPVVFDLWLLFKIFRKYSKKANLCLFLYSDNFDLIQRFIEKNKSKNIQIYLIPIDILKISLHTNSIIEIEKIINFSIKDNELSFNFICILKKYLTNKLFLITNLINHQEINNIKSRNFQNNLGLVVHARMSSKRLPGKAMLKIKGEPIILKILERIARYFGKEKTVLSTSKNSNDDYMSTFIQEKGFKVYRGEEENLAQRLMEVAVDQDFSHIVRVTGDDLFRDFQSIEKMFSRMINQNLHYIFSDDLILGCNSEIMTRESLMFINYFSKYPQNTHALSWYLDRKEIFKYEEFNHCLPKRHSISLMLDEQNDFESLSKLWINNDELLSSKWQYNQLLSAVDKNLNLFNFHPDDVGLLKRNKNEFSFNFDT